MSIARHHNEWLSLVEVSGPFLSLPVLMRAFPQGLEALDRDGLAELRLAYEEWLDDQNSLRPSPAIHSVWVRYVLQHVLGFEKTNLLEGPAIPTTLKAFVAEQGETLRPDLVIANSPNTTGEGLGVRALIQVYPISQGLEKSMQDRRWKASPAMRMLELLRATGVSLGLVTNGEQWMLINAPKGETSAFVSWYAALWLEEPLTLRAFTSLLGATRFFSVADDDTLEGMLKDSVNEQQEVTDQLGYQVRRAVEVLIRAVDKADQDRGRALLKDIRESDLYEAAITVMMRLVFIFSAEERGLLLLGDPLYDQNYAVSTLRAQLRETADQQGEEVLERRFDAWCRLLATFRAVHDGIHHDRLNLPAYGGSLFDPERYPFLEGRTALIPLRDTFPDPSLEGRRESPLPISNRTVLHLLEALQILRVKVPGGGPAEARRLSFRALDVEQIGHVYEGLLDHIAVRASEPVLGLAGTRDKEPELTLPALLAEEAKSEKSFLAFLKEQTGRSENALHKALEEKPDVFTSQHLQIACNNDSKMYERVARFAGLVRADDFGYPAVFLPGSVYVTAGATRRATGTHYTPRSLTEPIVQHTLEPLVYTGPAEGLPKEQWMLKSPAELLELKVCDMAMGSAGFLVQVVRYLSERLVEAWDEVSLSLSASSQRREAPLLGSEDGSEGRVALSPRNNFPQITPEGKPATGKPGELIIPKDDEERLILARRLVADRCIYGVDKNPLAVEIAKLSIWLITMDKGRPFTFLDHALKCGDSLVGADEEMYRKWAFSRKDAAFTLDLEVLNQHLETARHLRKELESFTVLDVRDSEHKAQLLQEADEAIARVKLGCDMLVGLRLLGLKAVEQQELLAHLLADYVAGLPMESLDARHAMNAAHKEHAFHWQFEFPEAFERGGFSAFVGNPPFGGGRNTTTAMGRQYKGYLETGYDDVATSADICTYFFRKSFALLRKCGGIGLIATNTIAQGSTREGGLEKIIDSGGIIYDGIPSVSWPGAAAVIISIVHILKGAWHGKKLLDGKEVDEITAFLDSTVSGQNPVKLLSSSGRSFQGCITRGTGFILTPDEAIKLIENNPKNSDVIFPYLVGSDVNSNYDQSPNRWVINFGDLPLEIAQRDYPECLSIVRDRVFEYRQTVKTERVKQEWWLFEHRAPAMFKAIEQLDRVLIRSRVSNLHSPVFVPKGSIYSDATVVFAIDKYWEYVIIQSSIHDSWARKYSSTMKTDLRYSPTDCFETFPFPKSSTRLEDIGKSYHELRHKIMLERQEGLTSTYNRFHNPKEKNADIVHLRELHIEMDNAVAAAYGWNDLDLGHGFHETPQGVRFTISEAARREVLSRLLKLNHERYEEEVKAGLHRDKKSTTKPNSGKPEAKSAPSHRLKEQPSLLYEAEPVVVETEISQDVPEEKPTPTPTEQIGSWDQCICLVCGKHLVGFSVAEHTKTNHQGKDPGFRKI